MAINNLASLRLALLDWTARTDIDNSTADIFIDLAETEILNGVFDPSGRAILPPLQCHRMEVTNASFPLVGEYTSLPTNFHGFRKVKLNGNPARDLDYATPKVFDATFLSSDHTSTPAAYTIEGGLLRVGPNAGATDTLSITYYEAPDNLVATGDNWLVLTYPLVYLYGSLRHLAIYTGAERQLPYFQSAFISALAAVHSKEKSVQFSGTAMTSRTLGVTTT